MKVRILLVAEMEVEDSPELDADNQAQRKLDAFREAVQPCNEHDISLWRFNPEDNLDMLFLKQIELDKKMHPFLVNLD